MLKLFRRNLFSSSAVTLGAPDAVTTAPKMLWRHLAVNAASAETSRPLAPQRLPVPALDRTLDKFLRSVRPLLSDKEIASTEKVVRSFAAPNGVGRKLQKLLEEKASRTDNWLAEWWVRAAYLGFRLPVEVHSSPGIQLPHQSFASQDCHLSFAAHFILGTLDYKRILDENRLPQERMGQQLLDMSQYYKVFGTCRRPGVPLDSVLFLQPGEQPRHIVVAHNNELFSVDVLDERGRPVTHGRLVAQLRSVVEQSERPARPVGVLTADHRDTWAAHYQLLAREHENRRPLEALEKSLFVVCLDGPAPGLGAPNQQSVSGQLMLHGGGSRASGGNRWYDKALQIVVGAGGDVGCVYEHSPAEGGPVGCLLDHALEHTEKQADVFSFNSAPENISPPRKLAFKLTPEIEEGIDAALKNLDELVNNVELNCSTFPDFGKDHLKSVKVSPDSFIQMAIQLAFYRIHGQPAAHYESASLRKFVHGRTETIRSCSLESVDFAEKMLGGAASDAEKHAAMMDAINYHRNYAIEAVNGNGVDRHLLGLKMIAVDNMMDVPEFFKDVGYTRSTHFRLSTSQVPFRCDGMLSFGPVVPDGYGVCYNPRDKTINFSISAFRSDPGTSARQLRESLYASLRDMYELRARSQLASKL
ncbi:carnitine O-acetyltransferase-like isoform X1 [Bacillus rossius redtenbacheri]